MFNQFFSLFSHQFIAQLATFIIDKMNNYDYKSREESIVEHTNIENVVDEKQFEMQQKSTNANEYKRRIELAQKLHVI